MAKMRDIKRGIRAVNPIEFRRANAGPAEPGTDPGSDSAEVKLGVRVLLPGETADVYQRAEEAARHRGVTSWDPDHPICHLYEMLYTVLVACVDIESPPDARQPFFESVEQILEDDELGQDNLVLLHEKYIDWSDDVSGRGARLTVDKAIRLVLDDSTAKDGEITPLVRLPRASLVSLARTMGSLWFTSLNSRSSSGSSSEESLESGKSQPQGTPDPRPEAGDGGGKPAGGMGGAQ